MHLTSSSPQLTASFPGQHAVVRPGDVLDLTAHLACELDAAGQPKMARVTAELRGVSITSFFRHRGNHTDRRTEETILLSQLQTIWTPGQTRSFAPSSSASSSTTAPTIDLPVRFQFPAQQRLPPSFQGGSRTGSLFSGRRQIDGQEVARVVYFVKLHGVKHATFAIDDRIVLPFVFAPTPDPVDMPDTLVFAAQADYAHEPPPPPTTAQRWATLGLEHYYREKLLAKQSLLSISFSAPAVSAVPIGSFWPFRLSLLTFSPPVSDAVPAPFFPSKGWSRAAPPDAPVVVPDLAKLELHLARVVYSKARGASQTFVQVVGPAYNFAHERRVWFSAPHLVDIDAYGRLTGGGRKGKGKPGEVRWAVEVVVVGEMLLGKGPTGGISSSFGPDVTGGLLSCSYHLSLKVPRKGVLSTLDADPFVPVVLGPPAHAYGDPPEASDAPPEYFDLGGGAGSGFGDAKGG